MPGLWFEDFEADAIIDHGEAPVTLEDNVAFCRMTRNTQPLHFNAAAAREAGFRDVLINGLYTFSLSVGMTVGDLTEGTLIANLGYEDVRHPAPVFPGDRIRVRSRIVDKRPSSKPGRGVVTIEHTVANQADQVVCTYRRVALVRCRPEERE